MKWTSIKEKLPNAVEFVDECEISARVLINDNEILIGSYCIKHRDWQSEGMTCYNVTHWMPLPEWPDK